MSGEGSRGKRLAHPVTVPRLGWSMTEGTLVAWLKRDGEAVVAGEGLYTLEGDKAAQDVEATETGVWRLLPGGPGAGTVVKVGDLLGYVVGERGEGGASGTKGKDGKDGPQSRGRVATPRARRVARELGVDWAGLTGTGRGGRVRERDVRAAGAASAAAGPARSDGRVMKEEALRGFVEEVLQAAGMSGEDATTGAEVLVTTDLWGIHTHGTKLLAGYLRRLKAGGLRARGEPRVVAEGGSWATVDGDSSLAMVTSVFAMRVAMGKARRQGLAYVGVRNSCHFGAAGYYAWLAAREGLIGIAMANDIPCVAAPGSRGPITGSNPLAYAVPAGRHRPMLLDISTATVAGGKVYAARARGEAIPGNWIIDGEGRPTTDPGGFPQVGALLPMAGHKGYGIALLIETLSGILSGAAVTWGVRSWAHDDDTRATGHGAAFLALDPRCLGAGDGFERKVEALVDEIHGSPRADGVERLLVPGEREWERYARGQRDGMALPADVWESLEEAAVRAGIALNPRDAGDAGATGERAAPRAGD